MNFTLTDVGIIIGIAGTLAAGLVFLGTKMFVTKSDMDVVREVMIEIKTDLRWLKTKLGGPE